MLSDPVPLVIPHFAGPPAEVSPVLELPKEFPVQLRVWFQSLLKRGVWHGRDH